MSYDLFVQGFDAGDAAPMPSSAFDVFRPHVDRRQPEYHLWHVRTPDGGEADIYADVTPGTFDSLMISRFSAGDPLDLLAEFTIRASAVILAPDGPAMLTAEAQREHLPGEFQKDALVVRNGDDIRQAFETFLHTAHHHRPPWSRRTRSPLLRVSTSPRKAPRSQARSARIGRDSDNVNSDCRDRLHVAQPSLGRLPADRVRGARLPAVRNAVTTGYYGIMDPSAVSGHDPGFAEHLTSEDLRLLRSTAGGMGDRGIEALLGDARVFDAVFGRPAAGFVTISPFLAFAVAVHRAAADLSVADYLTERSGLRQRVPLFDAPQLRDFLNSASRRLFLAELLASFTRVASGRYQVRSGGRTRSRRFSELDPVRLAGLLDAVPQESRPGVYRRLGDVSLFLAGVFPDYSAASAFGPVDTERLLRIARVPAPDRASMAAAPAIDLLEYLGARWYRAAVALAPVRTARLTAVGEVAERFRHARRILNHLADQYLLGPDSPWFTAPG